MSRILHLGNIEVDQTELAGLCWRYQVRELSLFGSAARGEMRPDSDIDQLVEFLPDAQVQALPKDLTLTLRIAAPPAGHAHHPFHRSCLNREVLSMPQVAAVRAGGLCWAGHGPHRPPVIVLADAAGVRKALIG